MNALFHGTGTGMGTGVPRRASRRAALPGPSPADGDDHLIARAVARVGKEELGGGAAHGRGVDDPDADPDGPSPDTD
jgi:hypothetical protein